MSNIKIWVDDVRPAPKDYIHCRTYNEAIGVLYQGMFGDDDIEEIWLDHDLGEQKSGYDIAKFIVEEKVCIGGFGCQSMNPVGRKNICNLLTHYGYKQL